MRTLLNAAPVASDDTYPAEFQTTLEVQTATRPLPRHSFVDTFSGDRLSPNLTDAAQVFVVADGVLSQQERRKYVTTKKTDYVTGDFLIELDVDLTTTANVIEFVGIGPGEPRGAYDEPEGSLYLRMHSVSFGGMMIVSAAGGFGGTEFGTITSPGVHHVRIEKSGQQVVFEIDADYDGIFQADLQYVVEDIQETAPFLTESNSRIFIGGSDKVSLDNLRIDSSLDPLETLGVLDNDSDPDGDALEAVLVEGPSNGQLTLQPDGTFNYTPDDGFVGTDTFTYVAFDGVDRSAPATVQLAVRSRPTAIDDHYETPEDTMLVVSAAAPGQTPLDWTQTVSQASPLNWWRFDELAGPTAVDHGRAGDHGTYYGDISFGQEGPTGGAIGFDGATSFVSVGAEDLGGEWTVEAIFLADTNSGNESMGLLGTRAGGEASIKADQYPNTGKLGITRFGSVDATFDHPTPTQAEHVVLVGGAEGVHLYVDGESAGALAVAIGLPRHVIGASHEDGGDAADYLRGVIDELVIYDRRLTANEILDHADAMTRPANGEEVPAGVLANDVDLDGDTLRVIGVDPPLHGALQLNDDGTFRYTPAAEFSGQDFFTYQVTDGVFTSATATATIVVTEVNDPPRAENDFNYQVIEGQVLEVAAEDGVLANDQDPEEGVLVATLVQSPSHGQVTLRPDGSFTYTLGSGYYTFDSFTYQAADQELTSAPATVTLRVIRPTGDRIGQLDAAADRFSVNEDSTLTVGTAPFFSVITADLKTTDLVYDPIGQRVYATVPNDGGARANTLTSLDPYTGRFLDTIPIGFEPKSLVLGEGSRTLFVITEDRRTVQLVDLDTHALGTPYQAPGSTEVLHIAPVPGRPEAVIISLADHGVGAGTFVFENGVQLPHQVGGPEVVAVNTDGNVAYGYQRSISSFEFWVMRLDSTGLTTTEYHPWGSVLSGFNISHMAATNTHLFVHNGSILDTTTLREVATLPGGRNFHVEASEQTVYSLDDNQGTFYATEADTLQQRATVEGFTFDVHDQSLIRFGGDGLAMRASDEVVFVRTDELFGISRRGVLRNDRGPANVALEVQLVEDVQHGQLRLHGDGTFQYQPDAHFAGIDSFQYRVVAEGETSNVATVEITVRPENDAPIAEPDIYVLPPTGPLVVPADAGVLANDDDPFDHDPLIALLDSHPAHGTVELNEDGSFFYRPTSTFEITDTFTYRASDGLDVSDPVTVTVRLDLPTIEVGDYVLRPNRPGQQIEIYVQGGQPVAGLDFFLQLGDGGPELDQLGLPPGQDGPSITHVELKQGTLFQNTPDVGIDLGSLPQVANWSISIADEGSVPAEGLLATVTVDTTGFFDGTWSLLLADLLPEHPSGPFSTNFAGMPIFITNGSLRIQPGEVVDQHVFYNNSRWDGMSAGASEADDAAIATDKRALLPEQRAGFAHYTSFNKGINGIMLDIAWLDEPELLTLDDFAFRVGRTDDPAEWSDAALPQMTLRRSAGTEGSDRFTLIWPDQAISQTWLEVRVIAGPRTLLPEDAAFYFGNAIGETGDRPGNTLVSSVDVIGTRDHQRGPFDLATIDTVYDFNRDRIVSAADTIIARDHQVGLLTALPLITPKRVSLPVAAEEASRAVAAPVHLQQLNAACSALATRRIDGTATGRNTTLVSLADAALRNC